MTQQLRSADYWQQLTSEKHLSLYYIIQKGHRLFFFYHPSFRTASSQTFKEDQGHRAEGGAERKFLSLSQKLFKFSIFFGASNHLCCLGMFPLDLGKISDAKPASLVSSCSWQMKFVVFLGSKISVFPLGECCASPHVPGRLISFRESSWSSWRGCSGGLQRW